MADDDELKKRVALKQKKQQKEALYNLWFLERERKIGNEEKALAERIKGKEKEGEEEGEKEEKKEEEKDSNVLPEEDAKKTDSDEDFEMNYEKELQILMGEKKKLEQMRQKKDGKNLDDEFVV
jgi:hypothetical protein